jgi:hypothetical protein
MLNGVAMELNDRESFLKRDSSEILKPYPSGNNHNARAYEVFA